MYHVHLLPEKASKGNSTINFTEFYRDEVFKSSWVHSNWSNTGLIWAILKRCSGWPVCDLHLKHEKLFCRLNKWHWKTVDKNISQRKPQVLPHYLQSSLPYEPANILAFKNNFALWIGCQVASFFFSWKEFWVQTLSRAILSWVWFLSPEDILILRLRRENWGCLLKEGICWTGNQKFYFFFCCFFPSPFETDQISYSGSWRNNKHGSLE